jgi:hypothetical protein
MTNKCPVDIIADNLPTYLDLPQGSLPSKWQMTKDAQRIIAALAEDGFEIVKKQE